MLKPSASFKRHANPAFKYKQVEANSQPGQCVSVCPAQLARAIQTAANAAPIQAAERRTDIQVIEPREWSGRKC